MKLTQQKLRSKRLSQIKDLDICSSGDDGVKVTPVPIPNTKVKLYSADGTALETVWKSRTLPGNIMRNS